VPYIFRLFDEPLEDSQTSMIGSADSQQLTSERLTVWLSSLTMDLQLYLVKS
jgi:hypothetical protein